LPGKKIEMEGGNRGTLGPVFSTATGRQGSTENQARLCIKDTKPGMNRRIYPNHGAATSFFENAKQEEG